MAHWPKWMLIVAFAIAQFGVVNGMAAYASPVEIMQNCGTTTDDCCDPAIFGHCTSCPKCIVDIGQPNRALVKTNVQIHRAIVPVILSPIVADIDLPPPRYRD